MRNGTIVRWTVAAACLVGTTAAAAPSSNYEAPKAKIEAADKGLGVATLSAVIGADGLLGRHTGVDTYKRLSAGTYEVLFQRDIRPCTYSATVGSTAAGVPTFGVPVVAWRANQPTGLWIRIFDKNGSPVDNAFHLIVFCGY